MNRKELTDRVKSEIDIRDHLTKSKGANMYVCPSCGSGTGAHATGALRVYNDNAGYCHSCGTRVSVVDAYMIRTGKGFDEAVEELGATIGLHLDAAASLYDFIPLPPDPRGAADAKTEARSDRKAAQEETPDYSAYYAQCCARLNLAPSVSYLESRGISYQTAAACGVGFDPDADPANAPGGAGTAQHPAPRLIFPTTRAHYVGRSIDLQTPAAYAKMNPKGATPGFFLVGVLDRAERDEPVFVVEGAFDALAVAEVGFKALAINSTANARRLVDRLNANPPRCRIVFCLDGDKTGKEKTAELQKLLVGAKFAFSFADINCGCKDPNDALVSKRDAFFKAVMAAEDKLRRKPDSIKHYLENNFVADIESFGDPIKTGFRNIDHMSAAGGLYPGLYVVAALSSLGKTTFCLQMADQLAAEGTDVLFFSLEQSRFELAAKSLARTVAQMTQNWEHPAATSTQIRRGNFSELVLPAIQKYTAAVSDRLCIIEGNFDTTLETITARVEQQRRESHGDGKLVVIIDYLQIVRPPKGDGWRHLSEREKVDETVTALRRMSRDLNIPVIAISSVNRGSYLNPIDFESLKESGNIEYSADVVWGLQPQIMRQDPEQSAIFLKDTDKVRKRELVEQAKKATPRKIELSCLKTRGGHLYRLNFDYYPAADLFVPDGAAI